MKKLHLLAYRLTLRAFILSINYVNYIYSWWPSDLCWHSKHDVFLGSIHRLCEIAPFESGPNALFHSCASYSQKLLYDEGTLPFLWCANTSKHLLGSQTDRDFYWTVENPIRIVSWLFWLHTIRNYWKITLQFKGKGWVICQRDTSEKTVKHSAYPTLPSSLPSW